MPISPFFKKRLRRAFYFLLFLAVFNTLEHVCHKLTDGFSLARIQFDTQEKPISTSAHIPTALQQPYHYLGCGNQCFAFISEDGTTVLKLFKYARHTPPAWLSQIPLLNRMKPLRPARIKKVLWKRQRDFHAYQLAFEQFQEEAGLLCLHLHPTAGNYPTLTLYDKLNIQHTLDLNQVPFVLQHKATPVYSQFSAWLAAGEMEKIQCGITSLLALCSKRISKHLLDDDATFHSNFGFIQERPIQIDPGHFKLSTAPLPPHEFDLLKSELKTWFAKHHPPLVTDVEACSP